MITLILDYAVVSPVVVEQYVLLSLLNVWVRNWKAIDEDFFEITLESMDDNDDDLIIMASEIMERWGC